VNLTQAFQFGLWNAWLLMIWQIILPILISTFLNKNNISSRLFVSAPLRHGKLLDLTSMFLTVLSVLYSFFLPLNMNTIWFFLGLLLFVLSVFIMFSTAFALRYSEIDQPFTTGMYRYSRHPFYFSMGLLYIGITFMTLSWIFLIFTILFFVQINIAALNEEHYCRKLYGNEYQEYMDRTPKWIGFPKPNIQ
jgi:protein-S-isoprenylcysteine O-methyltransferase Ste14